MHQKHYNIKQTEITKKARFGRLLQPPAWKWSGFILKGKGK